MSTMIRVPDILYPALKEYAKARGISASSVVALALHDFMQLDKKPKPAPAKPEPEKPAPKVLTKVSEWDDWADE